MGHYKANLRDIEFNLFEVPETATTLHAGPYADLDEQTAREMLKEVRRLAENDLAESFASADQHPPIFDPATYTVSMPADFTKTFKTYLEAEWWRTEVPAELGGIAVPPSLRWALTEMVLGANPAVHMYSAGFAFSRVLHVFGTDDQRRLAEHLVKGRWGATMVLTEPDAGSDVGAGRTKAVQQPDGSWHITGVKRFITSGETDLFDNIVHFVLARPEGAGPGTKGLSLFIVPKYHCDLETGALGERNGVFTTGVENKMGLKVSTTCEIRFGEVDEIPAVGTLLGDTHDGIAQMFTIIEFARMMVGTKAIATLSTGYLNALDYAKTRIQGPDLTQSADKAAPRVPIIRHPDVRRSLLLQKSYAEGLRALMLFTAAQQDKVALVQEQGDQVAADSAEDLAMHVNDLLLPLVKGCGSERAWVLLGTESLQTFGGSGFLRDYPIEQYVRDAKIDTLYEGTTAIQGMDFFFRKIVRDRGRALGHLSSLIQSFIKAGGSEDPLSHERELLSTALDDVQAMVGAMVGMTIAADPRRPDADPSSLYKVGENTSRLLLAAGDLVVGWLLLRQAEVAAAAMPQATPADQDFYRGKIAGAQFFAKNVLPLLTAQRHLVERTDGSLMDIPENSF